MELLVEFIGELLFEGIIEIIKSPKVPKVIRFLLLSVIVLFYLFLIGAFILISINAFKTSFLSGIVALIIVLIVVALFLYFIKHLLVKKDDKN